MAATELHYGHRLLMNKTMHNTEARSLQTQEHLATIRTKSRGPAEGYEAHLLDAARLLENAWSEESKYNIREVEINSNSFV